MFTLPPRLLVLAALLLTTHFAHAADAPEPGFRSLFNGQDLSGWCYAGSEAFTGKAESSDGRYAAKDGVLVVNPPPPNVRKIQQMWTVEQFPTDFVLKLEFRASVGADSGIFIRKPQLQCRDYLVAGPYKELKSYKAQEWNQIEITVRRGVAHCTCNGEVLEAQLVVPATGPIGLEGDKGTMEYRNIQIKELP